MRAAAASGLAAAVVVFSPGAAARAGCTMPAGLGSVAYVAGGALRVVDVSRCATRTLVARGASAPVRWSHDGRFVAFGDGAVVDLRGGRVTHPIGRVFDWLWRPGRDELAGIARDGAVVVGRARFVRAGWPAIERLAFDPSGRALLVARARSVDGPWQVVDLSARGAREVAAKLREPPLPAALSRGGRWGFWWRRVGGASASLAADGYPVTVDGTRDLAPALLYPEFLSWCGDKLVVAAGYGRETTRAKRILVAAPPRWRVHDLSHDGRLSWVSPACSPDRRTIAVAAGRSGYARFGDEHRSIWLLGLDGSRRKLTSPPRGATDELPRWSRDGRYVLFVRTRHWSGALYAVDTRTGRVSGPAATIPGTMPYYGRYGWADTTDRLTS